TTSPGCTEPEGFSGTKVSIPFFNSALPLGPVLSDPVNRGAAPDNLCAAGPSATCTYDGVEAVQFGLCRGGSRLCRCDGILRASGLADEYGDRLRLCRAPELQGRCRN